MYASPSRLLPITVDLFNYIIEKQGARYALKLAFKKSTTTQIKQEGFKVIQDVQCLVLWREKDNLIPIRYYEMFRQKLPKANCEVDPDAGHAPFIEETALFHEKLSAFLIQNNNNK
jgi:homoserine acetyltransferase